VSPRKRRWIPILIALSWILAAAAAPAAAVDSVAIWNSLLERHMVVIDGGYASRVDYGGMQRDRAQLDVYTRQLSATTPAQFSALDRADQIAFLINAYNAFTVQLILTRWPHLESIKDLGGLFSDPWHQRFFTLLGRPMDLDQIEAMLRQPGRYDDPRIHFAINCASISCPMLQPHAYDGGQLDRQLQAAAARFIGDRTRNRYDRDQDAVQVSKIFDWYAADFRRGPDHSVTGLLARYAAELSDDPNIQTRIRRQQIDVKYASYDWRLNAVKAR
jgi:hypothetical protein